MTVSADAVVGACLVRECLKACKLLQSGFDETKSKDGFNASSGLARKNIRYQYGSRHLLSLLDMAHFFFFMQS